MINRREFSLGAAAAAATAAVAAPVVAVTGVSQVCSVTVTEIDYGLPPLMCMAGTVEDWAVPGLIEFRNVEPIFSLHLPEFGDI